MLATKGGLAVLVLGLAAMVTLAAGYMEELALMPKLSHTWTPVATAALQGFPAWDGLLKAWILPGRALGLLDIVAYILLIAWVMRLYLVHFWLHSLEQPGHSWLLLSLLLLLFIGAAMSMVSAYPFLPYLFPVTAFSIFVAMLVDEQLGILVAVLAGLAIGFADNASLALTTYAVIGGLIGVLSLRWAERRYRLLWSGACIALSNLVVVLIFSISGSEPNLLELSRLPIIGIANGFLSASLASFGFFLANALLGHMTSVQLMELAQPTNPLLRQLFQRAPGSYQHSLMVSNLAEQAAQQIGADAPLVRAGALYHDVGKILQPEFFVENQLPGVNGHDHRDPRASAQIIIGHVKNGLDLARKYHLPREVRAFIAEHHGTSLVRSFYRQALEQAGDPAQVNEADFRYPGPRPRSRETAIVMLADSCEAAARAGNPTSVEEITHIVQGIIADRASSGELDESGLTIHEMNQVRDTFVRVLQGVLHRRIKYPEENTEPLVVLSRPAADSWSLDRQTV